MRKLQSSVFIKAVGPSALSLFLGWTLLDTGFFIHYFGINTGAEIAAGWVFVTIGVVLVFGGLAVDVLDIIFGS